MTEYGLPQRGHKKLPKCNLLCNVCLLSIIVLKEYVWLRMDIKFDKILYAVKLSGNVRLYDKNMLEYYIKWGFKLYLNEIICHYRWFEGLEFH
jgi:hypothetical protein